MECGEPGLTKDLPLLASPTCLVFHRSRPMRPLVIGYLRFMFFGAYIDLRVFPPPKIFFFSRPSREILSTSPFLPKQSLSPVFSCSLMIDLPLLSFRQHGMVCIRHSPLVENLSSPLDFRFSLNTPPTCISLTQSLSALFPPHVSLLPIFTLLWDDVVNVCLPLLY